LQAKITNDSYMDPDHLLFTDITILGMDKEPSNFIVTSNNATTSISSVVYRASTKVRDYSIHRALLKALARDPESWSSLDLIGKATLS
jgi:hypothetical protein